MNPTIECLNCENVFEKRKLRCPSCNEIGVSKLYKYLPFNENSLSLLINEQIWCPKASTLNDPFEFRFHMIGTHDDGRPIAQSSVEKAINNTKELGVISLSEINDDILMWSHYAEGHTGFCIEFERSHDNALGRYDECLPVIYDSAKVPSFEPKDIEIQKDPMLVILTTKAPNWSYEKEWRLIIEKRSSNDLIKLPTKITSVIFGCKMDDAKRRTILNILDDDMMYSEAKQSKESFSLDIVSFLS